MVAVIAGILLNGLGFAEGLVGCSGYQAPLGDVSLAQAQYRLEGSDPVDDETSNLGYYGVAAGDVNGDGRIDLAATDFGVGARLGVFPESAPVDLPGDTFGVSVALVDVVAGGADEWLVGRRTGGVTDCYYGEPRIPHDAVDVYDASSGTANRFATLQIVAAVCSTNDVQVARVGDTDGDGSDDLAVHGTGGIYLIRSVSGDAAIEDIAEVFLAGANPQDRFADRLASGDLDGDGQHELIASIEPYYSGVNAVFIAPPFVDGALIDPTSSPGLSGLPSAEITSGGDLNGDGTDDVVAASGDVWAFAGAVDAIDAADAVGELLAHPFPDTPMYSVAIADDLDGDGVDDLLAGSAANVGTEAGGVVAVWYGPVSGTRSFLETDARLLGEVPGDGAGGRVLGPGDVNGDGFGDVVVAATGWDLGRGAVYVLQGGPRL